MIMGKCNENKKQLNETIEKDYENSQIQNQVNNESFFIIALGIFRIIIVQSQQKQQIKKQMGVSRLHWTHQQQQLLKNLKQQNIQVSWKQIAEKLNQLFPSKERTGKQCRQRFVNYVKFNKSNHSSAEWNTNQDQILFKKYSIIGAKWVIISRQLTGKSENNIKNRFYGVLRKFIRKTNKCIRDIKLKNRKPIRLETIVQILDSKTRNSKLMTYSEDNYVRSNQFLEGLAQDILKIILSGQEQMEENSAKSIIERLYLFTSSNKKNKKMITNSETRKELSIEEEQQKIEIIFEELKKLSDSDMNKEDQVQMTELEKLSSKNNEEQTEKIFNNCEYQNIFDDLNNKNDSKCGENNLIQQDFFNFDGSNWDYFPF